MGFSGGSSNVTKAHTHDSNVVQDGGSLAANVTQFGLSAGSILYSDGSNIQELAVGSASDALVVNGAATAPEWGSGGGAGGNMEFIERFTKTSASDVFDCSLASAIALTDFTSLIAIFNGRFDLTGTGSLELQIGTNNEAPITGTFYDSKSTILTTGTSINIDNNIDNWTVGATEGGVGAGTAGTIYMEISIPAIVGGGGGGTYNPSNIYIKWNQVGTSSLQQWGHGFTYDNTGAITTITSFVFTNSAGNNFNTASTVDIYKLTR
jgi:hypothetical protein